MISALLGHSPVILGITESGPAKLSSSLHGMEPEIQALIAPHKANAGPGCAESHANLSAYLFSCLGRPMAECKPGLMQRHQLYCIIVKKLFTSWLLGGLC